MRRMWAGLGMAIALAAITAGGIVISQDGDGEATAAGYVASAGSAGCTRASPAVTYSTAVTNGNVCLTLAQACNIAQPGDTVIVKAGTYAAQTVNSSNCPNASSSAQITFVGENTAAIPSAGASSDAPFLGGACTDDCGESLAVGSAANGPSYVTFRNFRVAGGVCLEGNKLMTTPGTNATSIEIDHLTVGYICTSGVTNALVTNNDFGDCYTDLIPSRPTSRCTATNSFDNAQSGSGGNRASSSAIYRGNWFHDYRACPISTCSSPDDHSEAFIALDWSDVTFERNRFWNNSVSCGIRIERINTPAAGVQLTIQNNWFGDCYDGYTVGGGWENSRCENITWGANSGDLQQVLIRYNTFTAGTGPFGSSGSPESTFRIIGNLVGFDPNGSCEITPANNNYGSATVDSNVWVGGDDGTNSAHVANETAFNALLVNPSGGSSANYHLSGSTSPPSAYVTCTSGDQNLTTDYDGDARTNLCSAGSDE